ncbi:hypothetical protein ACIBL8_41405 [Streptomyces sp. NPDC050523]|uniref:hypothetical protein n=1 Tax=Streptomyces sp. NPDC050523 TaxID=3365622 RepID=UPI00379B808F
MSDLADLLAPFGTPRPVAAAITARDTAYDALADAELKYVDVSDDAWQARAHQRDAEAARTATLAGEPLPSGPSHYERAAALRGEALGVLDALRSQARKADAAVTLAWQAAAAGMADNVRAAYTAAEKAYEEAAQAKRNARGTMRTAATALAGIQHVGKAGPLPRMDGNPPWDMDFSEFCRRFVASHGLTIDTDAPEYQAVISDGLVRFLPADVAAQFLAAGVVHPTDATDDGQTRTAANGTTYRAS